MTPRPGTITIRSCSVPGAWYDKMVGQTIPFEWKDSYGYWARECGGIFSAINWIKESDAVDHDTPMLYGADLD